MPARIDARLLVAVFAGGMAGALARAGLETALPHTPGSWPWATFAANLAGAALLGWLATRLQERQPPTRYAHPLLATGFCGAFTTFATLQLELLQMLEAGRIGLAAAYAAATIAAGLAGVVLATAIGRRARLA